jgi:hypothetical protein
MTNTIPEYERLGLSLTEWNLVQQHHMSLDRVKSFLRDGISVAEYFREPWVSIGITEAQWFANRRRGLSDDDMRGQGRTASAGEWAFIQNFFVPGLHQWIRHDYGKAAAMSGIAVVSLGLYAGLRDTKKNPKSIGFDYPVPFLIILAGDMLWSSIDIGVTIMHENNPDAARFSVVPREGMGAGITYTMEF